MRRCALALVLLLGLLLGPAPTALGAGPGAPASVAAPVAAGAPAAPSATSVPPLASLSAGGEHTCAVTRTGTLWCWGRDTYGQLGDRRMAAGSATPVQVGRRAGWAQVSAGGATTCAVRVSHELLCWGLDHRGQLGDGDTHAVDRPQSVPGGRTWTQVATAWFHTCGVRTDHSLWCWGDNASGQLGQGGTGQDRRLHRVAGDWLSVAVGGSTTCGIRTDHSLWCWGRNTFGQVGDHSFTDRSRPVRVGTARWSRVALSWTHACGVSRGAVARCWGRNDQGQVGEGSPTYVDQPAVVPGGHHAASVAVAEGTSCLLDQAGATWCWGDNRYGQISSQQPATPGSPTPVGRGGRATALSGGWFHLCGLTAAGRAACWGEDERGQLGDSGPTPAPPAAAVAPPPGRRGGPLTMRLASFNTLGNHHSQPGRDADRFAPARVRADWEAQALLNNGIQVAGIEEQDAGQLAAILTAGSGRLASFPTPAAGDLGVETTLVWDTRFFSAVRTRLLRLPFIARDLRRPYVELREKATGRKFWVLAVHNAPNSYQAKRDAEVRIETDKIRQLEQQGLPVFFVGDMNEKATVACKVLRGTGLDTPVDVRLQGSRCVTPKHMRVDWIFGSEKQVRWSGFEYARPPLVRLSTDHWVPVVDVTAP